MVVPAALLNTLLEPELLKDTAWLGTGLPWVSNTVSVREVVLVPLAVTLLGLATRVVVVVEGGPATNVMAAVSTTEPTVAVTVFASAVVEAKVVV